MFNVDSLSSNGQTIGSDALRKAIERNRKKNESQKELGRNENKWTPPSQNFDNNKSINSLVINDPIKKMRLEKNNDSDAGESEDRPFIRNQSRPKNTRESVATQNEEVSFISSLKEKRNKMTEILSYSNNRENRAKKNVSKDFSHLLVKLSWALVAVLILRLIIMNRGVWDYYSREKELSLKIEDYKTLLAENIAIRKEIFKIKNNNQLQKKLVRDHLGFISADEFLVLFPEEDENPAK